MQLWRRLMQPPVEDVMTTTEVMWFIRYKTLRSTSNWLRYHGVQAVTRNPGPRGENCYPRAAVEEAKRNVRGRGYRTDLERKRREV